MLADGGYLESPELEISIKRGVPVASLETSVTITFSGWERLAPMRSGSQVGFVAMSFADEMRTAFTIGIEPGIREVGYAPLRVDESTTMKRFATK